MKTHKIVLQRGSLGMLQTACGIRPYTYEKNNVLMAGPKLKYSWVGVPIKDRCKNCQKVLNKHG